MLIRCLLLHCYFRDKLINIDLIHRYLLIDISVEMALIEVKRREHFQKIILFFIIHCIFYLVYNTSISSKGV